MRPTGPMKAATAARMRATAQKLDTTHPETTAAGHVRDAATMLSSGRTDSAKRHLDAAMEVMTPRNLVRHGITDDDGHTAAKQAMHAVNRLRLQVMDIEDIHTANQAEAERRHTRQAEERDAKARRQAIRTGAFPQPVQTDANGQHPPAAPTGKGAVTTRPRTAAPAPPPGSTPGGAPKPMPPVSAQLSNEIELAYDPNQPRDTKGRWAHVPGSGVTSAMHALTHNTREQQRSGVFGSFGTYEFHQKALARLNTTQRKVYIRETRKGTSPGEALERALAHGRRQQPHYAEQTISGAHYQGYANQTGAVELAYNPAEPRGAHGEWKHMAGEFKALADHLAAPKSKGGHGLSREAATQVGHTTKLLQRLHQMQHGSGRSPGHSHPGVSVPGSMGLDAEIPGKTGTLLSAQLEAIELSARTAMLERTPAPYGKPGGPGLYGKAGNKHSDYFEQIVQALMRKRGMDKTTASKIAWGALKKWSRGGGKVHPEVVAASGRALGQEAAAGGHAHTADPWEVADRLIELAAGGPQWQTETRTPLGTFGSGGQGKQGKGKQAKGSKAARRVALVRKATALRMEIRQLEALLPHHTKGSAKHSGKGKSKSSTPAKKGAAAISAKQAKAGKGGAAAKAKTGKASMTPATIHAKIIALRAELAGVLAQIHQLSNDGDAIELSVAAWLHELRGYHGRWSKSGSPSAKMLKPVKPKPVKPKLVRERQKVARRLYQIHKRDYEPEQIRVVERSLGELEAPGRIGDHPRALTRAATQLTMERRVAEATGQPTQPITPEDLQAAVHKAVSEMRSAEYKLQAEEDKRRKQKLAIHAGALMGGAALTYAESKLGVPDLAQVMTAPGVLVGQELIDWARRL